MVLSLKQAAKPPLASLSTISYIISTASQTGRAGFQR
jgi:hypothetical protein